MSGKGRIRSVKEQVDYQVWFRLEAREYLNKAGSQIQAQVREFMNAYDADRVWLRLRSPILCQLKKPK